MENKNIICRKIFWRGRIMSLPFYKIHLSCQKSKGNFDCSFIHNSEITCRFTNLLFTPTVNLHKILSRMLFYPLLDSKHKMQKPVKLHCPALISANLYLIKKMLFGIFFTFPYCQCFPDILNIFFAG